VLDFQGGRNCPSVVQFVETRSRSGFGAVKGAIFHILMHSLCGYQENPFENRDLAIRAAA
jgi:hypothetical protein